MRIPKKYLIYSLFLIFFSFFFVNNSYAVDDYVFTINSSDYSTYNNQPICDNLQINTQIKCSDYKYYYYVINNNTYINNEFLYVRTNYELPGVSGNFRFPNFLNPSFIIEMGEILRLTLHSISGSTAYPNTSVTFGLTNTMPFQTPCSDPPSGSIEITSNGTYDVTSYAEAVVDVPATVIQGDYHDDLVRIYKAIMTCGAVVLVLYFFYCIYRMIIKSTGGKQ